MAKKEKIDLSKRAEAPPKEVGISNVLETNFMPYAMSVIISRAIPEIDGFKPSHRKLLYTMYRLGLLTGDRVKSTKATGQTMSLNPHGDASIYETLVRLTTGRETLLHPFIDSKGIFGKQYSDTPCAAARYTEVKLAKICEEVFGGIDKNAVEFIPNFDNTDTEPSILPVSFPNVLVTANLGIAVGMASNICSFNLGEICDSTIALIQNENLTVDELIEILVAPDFTTGGLLIYDKEQMKDIYRTGRGSFKVRSKYTVDTKGNRIEITEIPYTTTVEKIAEVIVALVKNGKIRDISDVRDEIDINGLKLTIDLKRGADPDKIMAKLFKLTALEDGFSCNFNILIGNVPHVMGIIEILNEWLKFRVNCLKRQFSYELEKKSEKLHLLYGLEKILLDIDKAIKIVRHTENDKDVIPNLMAGFEIDKIQAEYVADIKLRNLNREYILLRLDEIKDLEKEIEELSELIKSDKKIKNVIAKQLKEIKKKYGIPRKTFLLEGGGNDTEAFVEEVEDYPVVTFLSREGYFKKILPASLKGSDAQKYKEGDSLRFTQKTTNRAEILFFTSKAQVYKSKINDFDACKASSLGDYIPAKLSFDEGETVIAGISITDYESGFALFFENGKAVRIPASVYKTKTNRKKLSPAFFGGSLLVSAYMTGVYKEYLIKSNGLRALLVSEKQITEKTTRTSSGSSLFTLKRGQLITEAYPYDPENGDKLLKESKYRKSTLPSTGAIFENYDGNAMQIKLNDEQ